jgi:hypothetical protein
MVSHLDLKAGLQHLAYQPCEQPALAGQRDPLVAGPVDQFGRPVPQLPRIRHPATLRGNPVVESPVKVMVLILSSPRHAVADPRITPGYALRRTVPL